MAYIAKKKNREGKYYVYLVEGYRVKDKVKQRTLKNYGSLEKLEENEPGAYERLRQEAKDGIIGGKETKTIEAIFDVDAPITSDDKNYGWKILEGVYELLGVSPLLTEHIEGSHAKIDLDKVLKLLVFQRILQPNSKLGTYNSQDSLFGSWDVDINAIYRSLEPLIKLKESLQLQMHKSITQNIGRTATLVFYDVTNYYFEVDVDDEDIVDEDGVIEEGLRRRGASKERRPKPIVQLGLFMDSNGIPISYELFRGNQTDPITYLPAIEQLKKQFGIERVVVVADKAMNSKGNVKETLQNNDGWLFSQKHRGKVGASKDLQSFLLDASDWEYNDRLTFAKKSMIRTRTLERGTKKKEAVEVQEKVLVTWNKKYADREKIRRDGALDYASKLTDAELFRRTCKKGGKKYLNLFTYDEETQQQVAYSPFIDINKTEVAFDEQFDGMNVLVTSEIEMSDEEMLENYKELSKIEDCFKITKTEFQTRPVFVSKPEHIKAHFFICFMALTILRILQHTITRTPLETMSPRRIVEALNSAKANDIKNGYYRVQANEDMKSLNEAFGMTDWNNAFVKTETLMKYAKSWCTTFYLK